jgi:16S rRNA (cytosine967-C5)-methyltransferase
MTPAARLQAAVEVLEQAMAGDTPADRVLVAWGRAHRFAGSKDRAAIADTVYRCLRQWRSLGWALAQVGTPPARAAVLGAALADGADPDALCSGPHAPAPLSAAERAALAAPPPMPDPVRLDYPDWLDGPLRDSLGPDFEPALRALRERAPVDLRVNTLKASREAACAALAAEGIGTVPVALCPTALRAAPGAPVARSRAYAEGLVELQDAASQAAAALPAAQPGETVLDFCAGGGGKTLALAAAMQGRGRLVAHDADPGRLRDLPARAARAGARVEVASPGSLAALLGRCDLVFVDAPCSGSGAWRRDPWGKWRLTPERLEALADLQARILADAARYLRPGGRLAYATCSLLAVENAQGDRWAGCPPAARLRLTPADGCDGFFCAVW